MNSSTLYSNLTFFAFLCAALVIAGIIGYREKRRAETSLLRRLRDGYGKPPGPSLSPEENREHIPGYYRHHPEEWQIDDITWNDLDMDRVYRRMNYCGSAAGEEYLYWQLRTPALKPGDPRISSEKMRLCDRNPEQRLRYQKIFFALGQTGRHSLADYLETLDALGKRSNAFHYLCAAAFAASLVLTTVETRTGVVALFSVIAFNILSYYRQKNENDTFLIPFRYLLRLLRCIDLLQKGQPRPARRRRNGFRGKKNDAGSAMGDDAGSTFESGIISDKKEEDPFPDETQELAALAKNLSRFRRGAELLMTAGGGGNPLDIILDYIRIILHLDLIKFNSMLAEIRAHREEIDRILTLIGGMDATIAAACFRASLPLASEPELWSAETAGEKESGKNGRAERFFADRLYHPLVSGAVPNSIQTAAHVLITGSNASGKSTFLKATALCALLSQTVSIAPADCYRAPFYRLYSSMALRDNLQGGESYFIVEIRSLKRILDAAEKKNTAPVLCFVDEVLRGTNTVERIAASSEILASFPERGITCFAATHDIELTGLLAECYDNYHFTETMENGDVRFDYRLLAGRAASRNAIRLLEAIGYDSALIRRAEERAGHFIETGEWQ
ncbi:MutS-related protein [Lachnoclostridium sp. Marseille-P6806]|uniref:MutS-related protein n=1 Tax=Lachnoclostridium sp. Marseille-P6806 TaxID=2364793 RepID=UPI0013EF4E3A|nr:hypothetical protein [Lachnoclostridium sp. Marseille-P6806]